MNQFTESEKIGRTLFKEILDQMQATNQAPTEDQFNPVDYHFTVKEKNVVAEIKVRSKCYETCDTHLMEVNKFEALEKDRIDNNLDAAYYVCFFGENVCYWYSTSIIKKYAQKDWIPCPRTTAIYTGYRYKNTLMIPREKATVFTKSNGKWSKQVK